MKRTSKPPTRRSIAQQLDSQGPPDWEKPAWVNKALDRKVATGPRKHEEDDLQITLCEYLSLLRATRFWSVPNHLFGGAGGNRGAFLGYMVKEKKKGLTKGVSDLFVAFKSRHGQPALVVAEVKFGYNKPDEDQQKFLDDMDGFGFTSGAVWSLDDLIQLLRLAGHPGVN